MSDSADRATLDALVAALNVGDLEALDRVFTGDVVMEWPQSGERIVGGQNRREVYFFEMRAGLIARETGYWAKPFPAPDWRAPWVEHM